MRGEVGLVDHQEVGLGDARAALARHLVPAGDVDDVDGEVRQLAAVLRGEVVPPALHEEQLGRRIHLLHQPLERQQIVADVLADRRVRTAAGLHRPDALGGERLVADQELGVLPGEDVVGHHAEAQPVAQQPAQREHQRGLPAPHRATDPHGEGAPAGVAPERPLPVVEVPGVVGVGVVAFVAHLADSFRTGTAASGAGRACRAAGRAAAPAGPASSTPSAGAAARHLVERRAELAPACAAPRRFPPSPRRTPAESTPRAVLQRKSRCVSSSDIPSARKTTPQSGARCMHSPSGAGGVSPGNTRAQVEKNARALGPARAVGDVVGEEGVGAGVEARPAPPGRTRRSWTRGSAPNPACHSASRANAASCPDLTGLRRRLEPAGVGEAAGGERRVGELEEAPGHHGPRTASTAG